MPMRGPEAGDHHYTRSWYRFSCIGFECSVHLVSPEHFFECNYLSAPARLRKKKIRLVVFFPIYPGITRTHYSDAHLHRGKLWGKWMAGMPAKETGIILRSARKINPEKKSFRFFYR